MKKFPKLIYMIRENEGKSDEYLNPISDLKYLPDESCCVAIYELKNIKNLIVTKELK